MSFPNVENDFMFPYRRNLLKEPSCSLQAITPLSDVGEWALLPYLPKLESQALGPLDPGS